jgi:ABC-type xylose transport system permease subunit
MAGVAFWAVKTKPLRIEKAGFALLSAFAMFVLLEEIDYGLHYYEYLMGIEWAESAEVRNLHNLGKVADFMKVSVDVGTAVLFLIVAWGCTRCPWAWLRYLAPSRWFTLTLAGMLIMRIITHALGDRERELAGPLGQMGAISRGNLSEFRELTVYYMFLVYVITLVYFRDYREFSKQLPGRRCLTR